MKRAALLVVVAGLVAPAFAHAEPCDSVVIDPIVTPVRDVELDAQRSACPRQDFALRVLSHALIDTPSFHGVLGGDLSLAGRATVHDDYELSAQLRVIDFTFVQNAVNKVTNTGFGPLLVGAMKSGTLGTGARAAIAAQLELPYTGDPMETLHVSGSLTGLVTGSLGERTVLHARLGVHGLHASSDAGSASWLALRAGADLVWLLRAHVAVMAGSDISAGWYDGFDHLLVRAGAHWRISDDDWRVRVGLAGPLGGDEQTNVIFELALVHGL